MSTASARPIAICDDHKMLTGSISLIGYLEKVDAEKRRCTLIIGPKKTMTVPFGPELLSVLLVCRDQWVKLHGLADWDRHTLKLTGYIATACLGASVSVPAEYFSDSRMLLHQYAAPENVGRKLRGSA